MEKINAILKLHTIFTLLLLQIALGIDISFSIFGNMAFLIALIIPSILTIPIIIYTLGRK